MQTYIATPLILMTAFFSSTVAAAEAKNFSCRAPSSRACLSSCLFASC